MSYFQSNLFEKEVLKFKSDEIFKSNYPIKQVDAQELIF